MAATTTILISSPIDGGLRAQGWRPMLEQADDSGIAHRHHLMEWTVTPHGQARGSLDQGSIKGCLPSAQ
jgi:hypothetical protein